MLNHVASQHIFSNVKHHNPEKVIFVIGAGVSCDATGFPLGQPMALSLMEKLLDSEKKKELFEKHIADLGKEYAFDPDDFKTKLFALNKIDSINLVRHVVRELELRKSDYRSEGYNILTRFLRDRYIDAVIDFNFDELLQISISKEQGTKQIALAVSDKEYEQVLKYYRKELARFHVPVHLKPHGSISREETLRFARKDFYRIEPGVFDIFSKLISDHPVKLVIIGFRMKLLDFTDRIRKIMHPDSEIYVIDKVEDVVGKNLHDMYKGFIQVSEEETLTSILKRLELKLK